MCGIVGYVGRRSAVPIIVEGLQRLEYRGYDSAGVAVANVSGIEVCKRVGKLGELKAALENKPMEGTIGIGHTRWATHGEPTEINAHPHLDCSGRIAIVHNGIIENYQPLRQQLAAEGHRFQSGTDSEVVAHLIERHLLSDCGLPRWIEAVQKSLLEIEGSYALVVLCADCPDTLIAARHHSPLIVGVGEGEHILASDVPAVLNATRDCIFMDDGEIAVVRNSEVTIEHLHEGLRVKQTTRIDWSLESAEKGGYPHFMLKEINEQPNVVRNLISRYAPDATQVVFPNLGMDEEELWHVRDIFIQACGTSWHAGLYGKMFLERRFLSYIPVDVDISSEFRYRDNPILEEHPLVIGISQSGETADTLGGLRAAHDMGLKVLSLVNVTGSTIARESDAVIYTLAGPEIGVASTKAYTAQIATLYLFSLYFGHIRGRVKSDRMERRLKRLKEIVLLMEEVLAEESQVQRVAERFHEAKDFLFTGRGFGFPNALEGALKLKEISYIHAEGYAAGELKHGPIALIDENMPVVAIATNGLVYEKVLSNIQEVKARKGNVIAIATRGNGDLRSIADEVIYVPPMPRSEDDIQTESLSPLVVALPLQLLAYHIAVLRGCDVDQPRNLAKSVTVE